MLKDKITRHNELKLGSFIDKETIKKLEAEVRNQALTAQDRVVARIELDDIKAQFEADRKEQQELYVEMMYAMQEDHSLVTREVFDSLECENLKQFMLFIKPSLLTTQEEWQAEFADAHSQDYRIQLVTLCPALNTEENCVLAESKGNTLFRNIAQVAKEKRKQYLSETQPPVENGKKKK